MSVVPFPSDRRRALRRAWLGAAAAATLSGAGMADVASFASAYAAETSGPASFADTVERVKGAVVSVKVKLSVASDDESDFEGRPRPHGGPVRALFQALWLAGSGG